MTTIAWLCLASFHKQPPELAHMPQSLVALGFGKCDAPVIEATAIASEKMRQAGDGCVVAVGVELPHKKRVSRGAKAMRQPMSYGRGEAICKPLAPLVYSGLCARRARWRRGHWCIGWQSWTTCAMVHHHKSSTASAVGLFSWEPAYSQGFLRMHSDFASLGMPPKFSHVDSLEPFLSPPSHFSASRSPEAPKNSPDRSRRYARTKR